MKLKNSLYVSLLLLLMACTSDDPPTPLPDDTDIFVTETNVWDRRVNLVGTQTEPGLTGTWTIESENDVQGQFSSTTNSVTSFQGSILEPYELRWTIDNGESFIYSQRRIFMSSGVPVDQVVQIERDIPKLLTLYTWRQLTLAGVTFTELIDDGGLTIPELLTEYKISVLYRDGITLEQFYQQGFTLTTLYQAFIDDNESWDFVRWFQTQGVSIDDLVAIGATIQELFDHAATKEELMDSNIPLKDLVDYFGASLCSYHFLNHGIPYQELIAEGILEETPTPGLYILNYLFVWTIHSGHVWDIQKLNQDYPIPNAQWFNGTQEQLLMIHENRDQLDLKLDLFAHKGRISSSTTIGSCGIGNSPLRRSVDLITGSVQYCVDGSMSYTLLPMIQL